MSTSTLAQVKSIQTYSQYCGPAVASAVTGFDRRRVAQALRHLERSAGRRSRHSTSATSLIKFFEAVGWDVQEELYRNSEAPTLESWLYAFCQGIWLVVTPGHVIAVRDGQVIEDNGVRHLRSKVIRAIRLSLTSSTITPENSNPHPPCQTDNPYGKMVLQSIISRKETTPMNTVTVTGSNRHQCVCSDNCPSTTTRTFSQGHDARLVSRLRDAVLNAEMDRDEAYAELRRRAGANGLHYKLDNAICNAMDRLEKQASRAFAKAQAKESKGPKAEKAAKSEPKFDTIAVDGFELHANPTASEPGVERKVGRWVREGNITEHQMVGGNKADTVRVFRYVDKSGNKVATTKHNNPSSN